MDANYDYNASFKSISLKLKKRFLRKPNVLDAIEEYTTLSKQLENEECHSLAGYCMQQVAKSYHSVGNTISESLALQTAAKLYLSNEIVSTVESGSVTFGEDLLSTISLYEECIRLHCEQNERILAGKLTCELADILSQKFDKHFESIPYYEKAIILFSNHTNLFESNSSLQVILTQFKLASLKVFTCDYSGALNLYTEIEQSILNKCIQKQENPSNNITSNTANISKAVLSSSVKQEFHSNKPSINQQQIYNKPIGYYSRLLVESDINKLLLLLYLKPTKMKPEHTSTIETYSWFQMPTNYLPITCMDKDLFILLQSFVMACQSDDSKLLTTLQIELWPHLNDVQNFLIDLITNQLKNSSYTDDLLY